MIIVGCEFHQENAPGHIDEGIQVADSFYLNLINGKHVELSNLFSGNTTPEEAIQKFTAIDSALGQLMTYEVVEVTTDVVSKDGEEIGTYRITTMCTYERGKTSEALTVIVKDDRYYIDEYSGYLE